jgi:hypothetical protein
MEAIDTMTKQVNNIVKTEKPEIIKVDLLTEDGKWVDGSVCDLRPKPSITNVQTFQGFGEAEINQIVDQRMSERQKLIEHEQMKEEVKQLTSENEELQNRIDELENRNDDLEIELESKKEIKYYAGMLGDILESFGIAKENIKKPFAELMGISERKEFTKKELPTTTATTTDNSGIIEETKETSTIGTAPEEQRRAEVISLIAEYLKTTGNDVLAKIFTIFSEIEGNNAVADELMEYLKNRKETSHENL